MFIATLFTITLTWKQPKYPSTEEWIKMMWHMYSGILLSHSLPTKGFCERIISSFDYHRPALKHLSS